ncbi:MAG TPA: TIGR02444 family protein [Caulobacteraceae bacterium]|nr:TIGR02444 family protein [Caulobacteraceae bacterium]
MRRPGARSFWLPLGLGATLGRGPGGSGRGHIVSLWAWASSAWASPGVEHACLDLQDRAGQSIVLLLWGGWCATCGRRMEPALAHRTVELVRPIETEILRPMRAIRRALAHTLSGLDDQTQQDAYAQVRAVELNLERAMLEVLERQMSEQSFETEAVADAAQTILMLMEIWIGGPIGEDDRTLAFALVEALA